MIYVRFQPLSWMCWLCCEFVSPHWDMTNVVIFLTFLVQGLDRIDTIPSSYRNHPRLDDHISWRVDLYFLTKYASHMTLVKKCIIVTFTASLSHSLHLTALLLQLSFFPCICCIYPYIYLATPSCHDYHLLHHISIYQHQHQLTSDQQHTRLFSPQHSHHSTTSLQTTTIRLSPNMRQTIYPTLSISHHHNAYVSTNHSLPPISPSR